MYQSNSAQPKNHACQIKFNHELQIRLTENTLTFWYQKYPFLIMFSVLGILAYYCSIAAHTRIKDIHREKAP